MLRVAPDSQSCTHWISDRLLSAVYIVAVVQVAEEQAALDALSELGMQQGGAEAILLHPCQVIQDVTSKALGRAPSPDVTLAAVHALATIAGHSHTALLAQ